MPKLLQTIITSILVLIGLELLAGLVNKKFHDIDKDTPISRTREFELNKSVSKVDRLYYCDFIHKNQNGHNLMYKNLLPYFEGRKSVWFFGGSTLYGKDCDSSQKSFVDLISENLKETNIKNFSKQGVGSDYSLDKLEKALRSYEVPEEVVWGHWINDISLKCTSDDRNYKLLKRYFHQKGIDVSKMVISNIKGNLIRVVYTLYQRSELFKLSIQLMNKAMMYISISSFVIHQSEGEESREIYSSLGCVGTNISSAVEYAIENYKINLNQLKKLSDKYGFKIRFLKLPRIENYYKESRPLIDKLLEEMFFPNYEQVREDFLKKTRFDLIDISKCLD